MKDDIVFTRHEEFPRSSNLITTSHTHARGGPSGTARTRRWHVFARGERRGQDRAAPREEDEDEDEDEAVSLAPTEADDGSRSSGSRAQSRGRPRGDPRGTQGAGVGRARDERQARGFQQGRNGRGLAAARALGQGVRCHVFRREETRSHPGGAFAHLVARRLVGVAGDRGSARVREKTETPGIEFRRDEQGQEIDSRQRRAERRRSPEQAHIVSRVGFGDARRDANI